ncbi:glycosyltransferase family 2 protein [Aquisalimonas sp.]|uniref:glycosyltransferase family 2 protein n=1 Tax=Aquisalimonas sp. TaxID=1872621 RepID=UPI0025BABC71|nr:glycosyltransferase family 2 protein [Aquisalimonas sp.]
MNARPESNPEQTNGLAIPARDVSVVLPARNEAAGLSDLLASLQRHLPEAEVIVVDDASEDDTRSTALDCGATVVSHPYSKGNGAAIKSGVRHASRPYIICMDADGQHRPEEIPKLMDRMALGYDLVIGARGRESQASGSRWLANHGYNLLASWVVGHRVDDLTSGFRMFRARRLREFLHLLPNGFSYPATSTMAFFRAGYSVGFVPITVQARHPSGKSHIRAFRDGLRFLLIIFRIATLYSPLKVFLPLALLFAGFTVSYYSYTFVTAGRFTNFGALLGVTSVLVFLIGLVSEQITQMMYAQSRDGDQRET